MTIDLKLGIFDDDMNEISCGAQKARHVTFDIDEDGNAFNVEKIEWQAPLGMLPAHVAWVGVMNRETVELKVRPMARGRTFSLSQGLTLAFDPGTFTIESQVFNLLKSKLGSKEELNFKTINVVEHQPKKTYSDKVLENAVRLFQITLLFCFTALTATGTAVVVHVARKFMGGE